MQDQANSAEPLTEIEIEQKLRHFNHEWVEALVQGDTATLGRLMDDRCMFTFALEGDDKAQFLADIERLSAEYLRKRVDVLINLGEKTNHAPAEAGIGEDRLRVVDRRVAGRLRREPLWARFLARRHRYADRS